MVSGNIDENGNLSFGTERILKSLVASDIATNPKKYYGIKVNYGGSSTFNGVGWKVFNVSGNTIQIIADDYVDVTNLPKADNITCSGYNLYATDYRTTLVNYINTESNWSSFLTTGAIGVKGGPSLEEFYNSYNSVYPNEIYIEENDSTIHDNIWFYGNEANPKSNNKYAATLTSAISEKGIKKELYYHMDTKGDSIYAYWLGGCSASDNFGVMRVGYNGALKNGYSYASVNGVCPIISLSSEIILEEQEDGSYNIRLENN